MNNFFLSSSYGHRYVAAILYYWSRLVMWMSFPCLHFTSSFWSFLCNLCRWWERKCRYWCDYSNCKYTHPCRVNSAMSKLTETAAIFQLGFHHMRRILFDTLSSNAPGSAWWYFSCAYRTNIAGLAQMCWIIIIPMKSQSGKSNFNLPYYS